MDLLKLWRFVAISALVTALMPSSRAAAQATSSQTGFPLEIAGNVGFGWLWNDESRRGEGLSAGGTLGAPLGDRFQADFAADYLTTTRDFSSDVHWRNRITLLTAGGAYGRLCPFYT